MTFYVDDERFDTVDEALARAMQLAEKEKGCIHVWHRISDDEVCEITAAVWPDGRVDLTFEGCRFA